MSAITVVGSANMDLLVEVPHLPTPGETVVGSDALRRPGGKGANQAVAVRRLGGHVALFAVLGVDPSGDDLRAAARAEGIDISHLVTCPDAPTGLAFILVRTDGENEIIMAPGANRFLDDRIAALPAQLAGSDALLLQLEIPLHTNLAAAHHARRLGKRTVLNAAPLPDVTDPTFAQLLGVVDVLVVNEGEAARLSGHDRHDQHGQQGKHGQQGRPADLEEWQRVARGLRELGPGLVVVTLGKQGAVAATARETLAQHAFPVATVDGTGAGDAFCGGLALALAAGHDVAQAVRQACATGALATARAGAQAALPARADVDRLLAQAGDRRAM